MKYCSECGSQVTQQVPAGDSRPRFVCGHCGAIHYQNPKIVTGCIAEWEGRILLCRRAIEPGLGFWTLPAGFMENGESTHEGAVRETLEEANARVRIDALYTLFNLPRIHQVHMHYRGRLLDGDVSAGVESLEVGLFHEQEIPWERIAFHVIRESLKRYFRDRRRGEGFPVYTGTIEQASLDPADYRFTPLVARS
jgi:ADP-ribose pyrophosphatase YjhB (NUDIX family)